MGIYFNEDGTTFIIPMKRPDWRHSKPRDLRTMLPAVTEMMGRIVEEYALTMEKMRAGAIKRKFPFDYRREAKETQATKKGKAAHEALEKKLKP